MKKYTLVLILISFMASSSYSDTIENIANGKSEIISPTLFFYQMKQQIWDLESASKEDIGHLDNISSPNDSITQESDNLKFSLDIQKYQKIQKLFNELEDFSINFGDNLATYIKKGEVVTGYHLHLLSKTFIAYHLMGHKTLEFQSIYSPGKKFNPNDFIDFNNDNKTKRNLFWLAANMKMFEKFITAYNTFYKKEAKLRRMLKSIFKISDRTKELASEIKKMALHTLKKKNRQHLKKFTLIYMEHKDKIKELAKNDYQIKILMNEIENNKKLALILSSKFYTLDSFTLVDKIANVGQQIISSLSGFFGNIAGSIKWRRGYLYENMEMVEKIKGQLKPLDIIFEKTPFALTDTFIPGYFGHSALWLGTETELKELGMWNHPLIVPYHDRIKLGQSIVEALRPGVGLNSVRGFFNIDHISILRVRNVLQDKIELPDIYERAMRNMGKDYDFNFDVTTVDKIVCSELLYHAFGKIKFPVKWRLGRPTIEPDLIAQVKFYDNSPLDFISFFESESKTKINHLRERDLGKRLGFVPNKERSNESLTAYDKKITKCRMIKSKRRIKTGSQRLNKRHTILKKICRTKLEQIIYTPPEVLSDKYNFQKL